MSFQNSIVLIQSDLKKENLDDNWQRMKADETKTGEALVLAKSQFTLDGKLCNKIGVDYEVFQNQQDECVNKVGSCTDNQILDFLNTKSATNIYNVTDHKVDQQTDVLTMKNQSGLTLNFSMTIQNQQLSFFVKESGIQINSLHYSFEEIQGKQGLIVDFKVRSYDSQIGNFQTRLECSKGGEKLKEQIYKIDQKTEIQIREVILQELTDSKENSCKLSIQTVSEELLDTIEFQLTT